jgi:hypothetical protein
MRARDKIKKWLLLCFALVLGCGMAHAAEWLPDGPTPPDTCRVIATCSPLEGGTITGILDGYYSIGTVLTFTATANPGYYFSGWSNGFGEVVSISTTYTFVVTYHCVLFANFTTHPGIGSLVTNADGSQGVLFHVNGAGTEGWMVALDDASPSCQWGDNSNVLALHEMPFQLPIALEDQSGYLNTSILRNYQDPANGYAASLVDFDNGWYLPSVGQLRKLYAALPFIETAITDAGGTTLSDGYYWSSSEYSTGEAFSPAFALSPNAKGGSCRVRAIRNYIIAGNNVVVAASNNSSYGTATVSGNGTFTNGQLVTVTATPNAGYAFDHWSEDGAAVSYDATYQFTFERSRSLVAHFVVPGSVGSIISNPDGSKGVVFWQSPDGTEGLMVALQDVSEGCNWSPNTNALTLVDKPYELPIALEDVSGNTNTRCIRKHLDTLSGNFAANIVDFEHGWYLPSAGELRKLYAALPLIENALAVAGGVTLTNYTYWSSTEYNSGQAATATFSMSGKNKMDTGPVRAIRHFSTLGANAISVKADDAALGTVSGGSSNFTYGQPVTVTATPNEGYIFNYWTENGMIVSYNAEYQFPFSRSRSLVAHFVVPGSVGSVVNNADGSRSVVFWQSPDGTEGLMVALEDASSDVCAWGANVNALTLINRPYELPIALEDVSGNTNTRCIRNHQGIENNYAATLVDFEHGWYLPSVGELRKLYAALPQIEPVLLNAGGVMLTGDTYWSSTEYDGGRAATATFSMGSKNKGDAGLVRAIRHFSASGPNAIAVKANDATLGTVSGSGTFSNGQTVTVTATPNPSYAFNYWTENGMIVSYDAEYSFPFTRSRSLVANFVLENSVGSIVTNADGSRGVVFYTDPSGEGYLMVALNDVSEGCVWGPNQNVEPLEDWPSVTPELLNDMDGQSNTQILRDWFENNASYAACKPDFAHGWYLPSAGQLRKLYAALPMVESIIINANGTLMTENSYWSSTERGSGTVWTPMFALSYDNKGNSCRVRAVSGVTNIPQVVTQTIALSQGWNWFSANVEITLTDLENALVEALPSTSIKIKSQSNGSTSYNGRTWRGALNSLDVTQMYMISVNTDCEITLTGVPINPAEHTVTISNGVNWIAFPLSQSMTLSNAFAGFAVSGDKVKSQTSTGNYNGTSWRPNISLEPGKGYMYISNMQGTRTFTFPASAK